MTCRWAQTRAQWVDAVVKVLSWWKNSPRSDVKTFLTSILSTWLSHSSFASIDHCIYISLSLLNLNFMITICKPIYVNMRHVPACMWLNNQSFLSDVFLQIEDSTSSHLYWWPSNTASVSHCTTEIIGWLDVTNIDAIWLEVLSSFGITDLVFGWKNHGKWRHHHKVKEGNGFLKKQVAYLKCYKIKWAEASRYGFVEWCSLNK